MRAAAIIERNGAILLMHRLKEGRTYFVFPGGTIEDGETPIEACAREVLEETGLTARSIQPVASQEERGQLTHYFRIQEFDGAVTLGGPEKERNSPSNHYSLEWVEVAHIPSKNLFPANANQLIGLKSERPNPSRG